MRQGRLRPKTLATCVDQAYPILIQRAREGRTIPYGELVRLMGGKPGTGGIGEVLDQIGKLELEARRPKLRALIVRADTHTVGGGFFGLPDTPRKLRRMRSEEWGDHRLSTADLRYWQRQLTRVLQYWKSV